MSIARKAKTARKRSAGHRPDIRRRFPFWMIGFWVIVAVGFPVGMEWLLGLVDPRVDFVPGSGLAPVHRSSQTARYFSTQYNDTITTDSRGFRICPELVRAGDSLEQPIVFLGGSPVEGVGVACARTMHGRLQSITTRRIHNAGIVGAKLETMEYQWNRLLAREKPMAVFLFVDDSMLDPPEAPTVGRSLGAIAATAVVSEPAADDTAEDGWLHEFTQQSALYRNALDSIPLSWRKQIGLENHRSSQEIYFKHEYYPDYRPSIRRQRSFSPIPQSAGHTGKDQTERESIVSPFIGELDRLVRRIQTARSVRYVTLVYIPSPDRFFLRRANGSMASLQEIRQANGFYNQLLEYSRGRSVRLIDGQALLLQGVHTNYFAEDPYLTAGGHEAISDFLKRFIPR